MELKNELFRFVSISGAGDDSKDELSFESLHFNFQNSEYMKRLAGSTNMDQMFWEVSNFKRTRMVYRWLDLGFSKNELNNFVRKINNALEKQNRSFFENFKDQLKGFEKNIFDNYTRIWESLYTAMLTPNHFQETIPVLVSMIRSHKTLFTVMKKFQEGELVDSFEAVYSKFSVVISKLEYQRFKRNYLTSIRGVMRNYSQQLSLEQVEELDHFGRFAIENRHQMTNGSFQQVLSSRLSSASPAAQRVIGQPKDYSDLIRSIQEEKGRLMDKDLEHLSSSKDEKMTEEDYLVVVDSFEKDSDHEEERELESLKSNMSSSTIRTDIPTTYKIQSVGIGNLYKVEEKLDHYLLHEISHIENVMKSEKKQRIFETVDEYTEKIETINQTETDVEKDQQENENYQLSNEVQSTIAQSIDVGASVNINGEYGVINFDSSVDFSYSYDKSISQNSSSNFSKNIVDKTVEKVKTKNYTKRETAIRRMNKERSIHGFNNVDGTGHVRGIYRWLDKVSQVTLKKYGKRMFYKLTLPNPADYIDHLEMKDAAQIVDEAPRVPDFDPKTLNYADYIETCKDQGLTNIPTPPPRYTQVSTTVKSATDTNSTSDGTSYTSLYSFSESLELSIPDGYVATHARLYLSTVGEGKKGTDKQRREVLVSIGGQKTAWNDNDIPEDSYIDTRFLTLSDYQAGRNLPLDNKHEHITGLLPVTVLGYGVRDYTLSVRVYCEVKDDYLDDWRLQIHGQVMQQYERKLYEYNQNKKIEEGREKVPEFVPERVKKEKIVISEIKKKCIDMFTRGKFVDLYSSYYMGGALPVILYNKSIRDGRKISFLENCIEWENMSYKFMPYYWSETTQWKTKFRVQDSDDLYETFRSSGACEVFLPVRRGYERGLRFLLKHDVDILSNDLPVFDAEEDFLVEDSLKKDDYKKIVDTWPINYPTDLVMVQSAVEAGGVLREIGNAEKNKNIKRHVN